MGTKITEVNKWEACIALWEKIANLHTYEINAIFAKTHIVHDVKNEMLVSLGYDKCRFGCPLCEVHYDSNCAECPIANYHGFMCACELSHSPYRMFRENHSPTCAKEFLYYLRELRERDDMGLLPTNRNLKPLLEQYTTW